MHLKQHQLLLFLTIANQQMNCIYYTHLLKWFIGILTADKNHIWATHEKLPQIFSFVIWDSQSVANKSLALFSTCMNEWEVTL